MATKLTLWLDETLIDQAKRYAKQHKTSLSKMVAKSLQKLRPKESLENLHPSVQALLGRLPTKLDVNALKDEYYQSLTKKSSK